MTDRERWIVYPLLFLALGASLRDKMIHPASFKNIVCQELTIVDEEFRVLAKIGASEASGNGRSSAYLEVNGIINAAAYAQGNILLIPTLQAAPGSAGEEPVRDIQPQPPARQEAQPDRGQLEPIEADKAGEVTERKDRED